jgi:hypothetical protein
LPFNDFIYGDVWLFGLVVWLDGGWWLFGLSIVPKLTLCKKCGRGAGGGVRSDNEGYCIKRTVFGMIVE